MNCNNSKCTKKITTQYNCNKCSQIFCSNMCMIEHVFQAHQNFENKKNPITIRRQSAVRSPFINQGEFVNEFENNSYYDYSNMDYVYDIKTNKKKILGVGAFGEVYLARHKKDQKLFAIKHVQKIKVLENGAKLDIIYREINIHRRLNQANIVKFYSFTETKDAFFLVLEYASSGTLFNLIKKKKNLDEKTAFHYFIQTSAAVLFLHENNLVHRDLKPENILIDENNNIKLCDFGWCVELSMGNRVTFCGTYEYMAPEIIKEKPYNQGIDIWSLGILLYELIHGYSPFRAKNNAEMEDYNEIFKNIVKYDFKIEKKNISEELKDLITKLLSPDIKVRIKAKDIFTHPWVVKFEKDLQGNLQDSQDKDNKDVKYSFMKSKEKESDKQSENSKLQIKKGEGYEESKVEIIDNKDIKENKEANFSKKKDELYQSALKDKEFSIFNNKNTESFSLFDHVLNNVQEKNKNKRKVTPDRERDNYNTQKNIIKLENTKDKNEYKLLSKNISYQNLGEERSKYDQPKKFLYSSNFDNEILNDQKILSAYENEGMKKHPESDFQAYRSYQEHEVSTSSNSSKNKKSKTTKLSNLNYDYDETPEDDFKYIEDRNDNSNDNDDVKHHHSNKNVLSNKTNKTQFKNSNFEIVPREERRDSKNINFYKKNKKEDNNSSRDKDLNKEEVLYNNKDYGDINKNIISALDILESAQVGKPRKEEEDNRSGWDKFLASFNPFKCG